MVVNLEVSRRFPFFRRRQHPGSVVSQPGHDTLPRVIAQIGVGKLLARTHAIDPMMVLPPEIMSEIFELCLPESHVSAGVGQVTEAPINVSQVSRSWREIALSTGKIWSFLVYEDGRQPQIIPLKILTLWSERAKGVGLSVHFGCSRRSSIPWFTERCQQHLNDLGGLGRWWRELHLHLEVTDAGFQPYTLDPSFLGGLEVLHSSNLLIQFDSQVPGAQYVSQLNRLSNLSQRDICVSTKLRDINFAMDYAVDFSSRADPGAFDLRFLFTLIRGASSSLLTISFSLSPHFRVDPGYRLQTQLLPELRSLTLLDNVASARSILDHITAPALETLCLQFRRLGSDSEVSPKREEWTSVVNFLRRSSPCLTDLKMVIDGFDADIREILSLTPRLRDLQLVTNAEEDSSMFDRFKAGINDLRRKGLFSEENNFLFVNETRRSLQEILHHIRPAPSWAKATLQRPAIRAL